MTDRQRLDTVSASGVVMMAAIGALITSHPDQKALLKAFDRAQELIMADLLTKATPDSFVAEVQDYFDGLRKAFKGRDE